MLKVKNFDEICQELQEIINSISHEKEFLNENFNIFVSGGSLNKFVNLLLNTHKKHHFYFFCDERIVEKDSIDSNYNGYSLLQQKTGTFK